MDDGTGPYLTTRELAELLRIKERKVYDLAAQGEVPCTRVTGKLLFPRGEIEAWMAAGHTGPAPAAPVQLPPILAGSHDPLLDWALHESGAGLASFVDGSFDGLDRFARHEASVCALHVAEPGGGWNIETVRARFGAQPVVLAGLATRQRGIVTAAGNPRGIAGLRDLAGLRFAARQDSAASQRLLLDLLQAEGIAAEDVLGPTAAPARSEDELARRIGAGQCDAGLGLAASARAHGLGFVPLIEERLDLLVWRRAWFEPPFQALAAFLRGPAFAARAAEMGGYGLDDLLTVRFNGA